MRGIPRISVLAGSRRLLSGALLLLVLASPLVAQTVRGSVTDPETGRPLWGAVIVLLEGEAGDVRAAGAIADAGGRFLFRAPAPGSYRLRVERIGYRSTTTPAFTLGEDEAVTHDLTASVEPVTLAELHVVGEARCRTLGEGGPEAYLLWEEARKALVATVITAEMEGYQFDAVLFRRRLDARRLRVEEEERRPAEGRGRHPFRSVPAARFAAGGYVQETAEGTMYYAPDAQILLSEAFLDDHCFLAREGEEPKLVGLGFQPVDGRELPEVEGTLWLDAATAELRHLEYRYVNLDLPIRSERIGGRVEFERLPDGGWIVRRWRIRMPVVGLERYRGFRPLTGETLERERPYLAAFLEEGGELTAVRGEDGVLVRSYGRASLAGRVVDAAGAPLSGATVRLVGSPFRTVADAAGRFRMEELPEGRYRASVSHPDLELLGYDPPDETVALREGVTTELRLALAPWEVVVEAACEGRRAVEDDRRAGGVLVGLVRLGPDGPPAPGARVEIAWRSARLERPAQAVRGRTVETKADSAGVYRVCGLPDGWPVTVRARSADRASPPVTVRVPGERCEARDCGVPVARPTHAPAAPLTPELSAGVVQQDLALGAADEDVTPHADVAEGSVGAGEDEGESPVGDVATTGGDAATELSSARLIGQVVDAETGEPVAAALVRIQGAEVSASTDEAGRFALPEVPPGSHLLEVEHLVYGTRSERLAAEAGQALAVTVRLAAEAVPVEPITVTVVAERRRRDLERTGFYDRKARVGGVYITREEIERKRAILLSDVLREIPGVELIRVGDTQYQIRMRSATPSIAERDCPVQYYVDGMLFNPGVPPAPGRGEPPLDAVLRLDNVVGIEVYRRSSEIPSRFRASKNARCGVIAIWTRER